MATQNQFPLSWDEKRARQTIEHYDRQSEDRAVAEDEAALPQINEEGKKAIALS